MYKRQDIDMDGVPLDTVTLTYKRDGKSYTVSYVPEATTRWMLGYYYNPDSDKVEITSLMRGYPMEQAGFQAGDVITGVNGTAVASAADLAAYWEQYPMDGKTLRISDVYKRQEQCFSGINTPSSESGSDEHQSFSLKRPRFSHSSATFFISPDFHVPLSLPVQVDCILRSKCSLYYWIL